MKKADNTIEYVEHGSLAEQAGLCAGDKVISINGSDFLDLLEYRYLMSEAEVTLEVLKKNGDTEIITIETDYEDIGITFREDLIGDAMSCTNKCIFCFIDQLPKGMRKTVYFKDDDTRLSFLQGNYVTLTNMNDTDIDRLIKMRVSPINISVHTTNPELRVKMLNNRFAGKCYDIMQKFAKNHMYMNCQIVSCPKVNDGAELDKTISDLAKLYPYVNSVSVVPVGLTRYREGLCRIEPYDKESSAAIVHQVLKWQGELLNTIGTRLVYLADEFFINAGIEIPSADEYEGFPQIENGVGLIASMKEEFDAAIEMVEKNRPRNRHVAIATGEISYAFIRSLADRIEEKCSGVKIDVTAVKNEFFGGGVSVTGLVCGQDIINQLKTEAKTLIIPDVMLRDNDDVFLDDVTVNDIEKALDVEVVKVLNDGYDFIEKILGENLEF